MTGPAAASPRQPLFTLAAVNRPRCRLAGPPLWRLDGALARNGRRRRDPRRGNADAARGQRSPDLLTPPLRRLVASPPTATSLLAASSPPLPPPLPPRLCALPAAGRWTTSPAARSPAPPLPFGRRARRQTRRLSWSLLRRSLTSWYLGEGHAQRGGARAALLHTCTLWVGCLLGRGPAHGEARRLWTTSRTFAVDGVCSRLRSCEQATWTTSRSTPVSSTSCAP